MSAAVIWAALSKLPWKAIGIALAILALVLAIERYGYTKGRHSRVGEVARITQDRDTALANQATLQAALDRQNDAVAALKADGDKRAMDGKAALAAAQRANAGLSDQAAALRRSAARGPKGDGPCLISETLGKVGSI